MREHRASRVIEFEDYYIYIYMCVCVKRKSSDNDKQRLRRPVGRKISLPWQVQLTIHKGVRIIRTLAILIWAIASELF